jgi:hypothetical protein
MEREERVRGSGRAPGVVKWAREYGCEWDASVAVADRTRLCC